MFTQKQLEWIITASQRNMELLKQEVGKAHSMDLARKLIDSHDVYASIVAVAQEAMSPAARLSAEMQAGTVRFVGPEPETMSELGAQAFRSRP
jgi:hypothetical protein